jgi:hypothetical protein
MAKYTFEKISKSKKRPLHSRRYKRTVTGGEDKAKGGPSDNRATVTTLFSINFSRMFFCRVIYTFMVVMVVKEEEI